MNKSTHTLPNNPASFFKTPRKLLADPNFTRDEKLKMLNEWEYDEKEKLVAEEENMRPRSHNRSRLSDVLEAKLKLRKNNDDEPHSPPTKQG